MSDFTQIGIQVSLGYGTFYFLWMIVPFFFGGSVISANFMNKEASTTYKTVIGFILHKNKFLNPN